MVRLNTLEKFLCFFTWREFGDSTVDEACFYFDISSKENVSLKIVSNVNELTEELGVGPFTLAI